MTNEHVFHGAKLALFIGACLVVIRRDDTPGLAWSGCLDLPGGGREPGETPEDCVIRETREELGLWVRPGQLVWRRHYTQPSEAWFFAAHLPEASAARIVLGDEGQAWELMTPEAFTTAQDAIPHFRHRVREYLSEALSEREEF